jgi:hypothetical protein
LKSWKEKTPSTQRSPVVDAILGNALTKDGGVVNDIRSLQAKVKELEKN